MSLIRQNDEHWRDNLLGLTLDAKLEREISLRHGVDVKEQTRRGISESSFVSVLNPQRKILDIGFNSPDDLILNNFGTWLAGIIRAPASTASTSSVSLIDTSNTSRTVNMYASNAAYTFNTIATQTLGTKIQLGSGNTAAARTNYAIETALGAAPENASFGTSAGSYASGSISYSGAVSAGGAGTVNEMGCFGLWYYSAATAEFMLFHDILSSGVAYIAGDTLNASYSITL